MGHHGVAPVKAQLKASAWQFASGEEALQWSTEVLRRRRLPKLSGLWREVREEGAENGISGRDEAWEADVVAARKGVRGYFLPQDGQERYDLALTVAGMLAGLGEGGRLLQEKAWGDWIDAVRLGTALTAQEQARREGRRVQINYCYSYRQLAERHGVDVKTVWRRGKAALGKLEEQLVARGMLWIYQAR